MKRIGLPHAFVAWTGFVLMTLSLADDDSEISFEVFADRILIIIDSGSFAAPHFVREGDTFQSLSEQFYGTPDDADLLAQVVGVDVNSDLEPGSTVYMIESNITLPLDPERRAAQIDEALQCAELFGSQAVEARWDMSLALASWGGSASEHEASKLMLIGQRDQATVLEFSFPDDTVMTRIFMGKVAPSAVSCKHPGQ